MKKIKAMIIDICKKNVVFRKMIRFFRLFFKKLNYLKYKLKYKVGDKTIFFEVYDGRNYTCSPKAIYEKMLSMKEFKNYKFPFAKKKGSLFGCLQCLSGRNGGVRTRDLLVPNQAHYQAVLRPVANQRFGARVIISLAKG